MAGGMTYTAIDSESLQTAEIYGKALVELGESCCASRGNG